MGHVQWYGERGGGGQRETGTTRIEEGPRASTKETSSGLNNAGRHPESRAGLATVRGWNRAHRHIIRACLPGPETKKTHTPGDACRHVEELKTIAGGAVSFAPPPTPEPSTTSLTGWGGGHTFIRDAGQETRRGHWLAISRRVVDFLRTDAK